MFTLHRAGGGGDRSPPTRISRPSSGDEPVFRTTTETDRSSHPEDSSDPHPPVSFTDDVGRSITIREYDGDREELLTMYRQFDDNDRAQGVPPRTQSQRRSWLGDLLEEGLHLIALNSERVVGHASLLPMSETRHELIVFVRPDYQIAGIGSKLVRALLGEGRRRGIESVWLSVGQHNRVAKQLYQSVGFRTLSRGREWEMERTL